MEGTLPPPSPTFYRAPPQERDVYLIGQNKECLPDFKIDNWVVLEVNSLQKRLEWRQTKKKNAIVLLMAGTYNFVTLGLDCCPYTRLEIIGVAPNNMHVLLTGTPNELEASHAITVGLMNHDVRGQNTRLQMRVNNVSIRQERNINAVYVSSKHSLELDTVSIFCRDDDHAAIESSRQALILLRNVTVTSDRSAIAAGGGLIILNSLFTGCGRHTEKEDPYGNCRSFSDPTILIEHHTHFFMSNSMMRNNFGNAVEKKRKFEFDEAAHERLAEQMFTRGMMDPGMTPANLMSLAKKTGAEKKEVALLPEGYRRIHSVTVQKNQSCSPLSVGHIRLEKR